MKKFKDFLSWNKRKPFLKEKFLTVPNFYQKHEEFGEIEFFKKKIFENKNKVFIEYCSGNGKWIIEKALKNPNINWIAVEKKFLRAKKIWQKMKNKNINNLLVVFGEGHTFTKFYLPKNSIFCVFINFPDPWPKRRHAKHRLVSKDFIKELEKVTVKDAKFFFVTDDMDTCDRILKTAFSQNLKSFLKKPYFVENIEGYGTSHFEELWRSKGKKIKYLQFFKESGQRDSNPRPTGPKPVALTKLRYAP